MADAIKVMRYNLKDFISKDGSTLYFCGMGFTQFDEESGAETSSSAYINNKNTSPYIKSYARTFAYAADVHKGGTDVEAIDILTNTSRNYHVGSDAEMYYFRTDPTIDDTGVDLLTNIPCRKIKVATENSGTSGDALDVIQTRGTLHQIGNHTEGFLTITEASGVFTYTFSETASDTETAAETQSEYSYED